VEIGLVTCMDRWDINKTRELITKKHGAAQLLAARHCLRSVHERLRHARYHFKEVGEALKSHIDDKLNTRTIYELTFLPDPKTWVDLDHTLMKAEAHSIACAQCIHAVGDILAHVVYFSLGLNLGAHPMKARDVSLSSIRKAIAATAKYSTILVQLTNLATDKYFLAIDAIVNHGKHRGVVEPQLSIEPSDASALYEFELGAFEYKDACYAEAEVEGVLAPAYLCVSEAVVRTGNALNEIMST
jgi:hypothetical protein